MLCCHYSLHFINVNVSLIEIIERGKNVLSDTGWHCARINTTCTAILQLLIVVKVKLFVHNLNEDHIIQCLAQFVNKN